MSNLYQEETKALRDLLAYEREQRQRAESEYRKAFDESIQRGGRISRLETALRAIAEGYTSDPKQTAELALKGGAE